MGGLRYTINEEQLKAVLSCDCDIEGMCDDLRRVTKILFEDEVRLHGLSRALATVSMVESVSNFLDCFKDEG